jgi:hypothetical protein
MTPRVRRDGAWVRKAVPDAASGPGLARRSQLLAARGIRTPQACYHASAREFVFPWISGIPGREMLRRADGLPAASHLAACLVPLVRLHGTDPAGLDLQPLNPWRRIDPRLLELQGTAYSDMARVLFRAALGARPSTERRLADLGVQRHGAAQAVVHGDFHIGQLLFARVGDEPWLLDLDDLALGPRESDLGNFAAHLATVDQCVNCTFDRFRGLTSLLCPLYDALAECRVDRNTVEAYGAIALLRRALKLHRRGAAAAAVLDPLFAAARLSHARRGGAPAPRIGACRMPGERTDACRSVTVDRKTAEA